MCLRSCYLCLGGRHNPVLLQGTPLWSMEEGGHLRKLDNSENLLDYSQSSLHSRRWMVFYSATQDFPVFSKLEKWLTRATSCWESGSRGKDIWPWECGVSLDRCLATWLLWGQAPAVECSLAPHTAMFPPIRGFLPGHVQENKTQTNTPESGSLWRQKFGDYVMHSLSGA